MEAATSDTKVLSPEEEVILCMLHGMWQNRCLSLLVGFNIPDLLCNAKESSMSIDDIASKIGCSSSKQLYPIMRVLAQWGIGKELNNKHFARNQAMELLRQDKGSSLGHFVHYYACDEHLTAMKMLPECVRKGTPAFTLVHNMSSFEYRNFSSSQPYDKDKMFYGCSEHPIGSTKRREELANATMHAMNYLSNLSMLPGKDVNNLYKVFPWEKCKKLIDMGGNSGSFVASVLKQPGCEHIQGYVVDIPEVIERAKANFHQLGVEKHRIKFIKQDFTKPFTSDLHVEADTVVFMNVIGLYMDDSDEVVNILDKTRCVFPENGGRLLIIDNCCPDSGNMEENVGINGRQLGFHSLHFTTLSGSGIYSKSEWVKALEEMTNKSNYKLNNVIDTFTGGFTIFQLEYNSGG